MSLAPLLFSDWWEDLEQPHSLYDQSFGLSIHPEQLLHPTMQERRPQRRLRSPVLYYRPWADMLRNKENGGVSTVKTSKDNFQIVLDVQHFKPEEINVKVVGKFIIIEAKHEEQKDEHGWISRQFIRKYMIPEQCDAEQITSNLSSDGVLVIIVAKKDKVNQQNERSIKIEQTGKPVAIQEKTPDKDKKEKKGL